MRYTVLIDGEAGGYGVVFPDLPGCTAMGDSVEEALINAGEAAVDWARAKRERSAALPLPRAVDELRRDPEVVEALASGSALATVPLIMDAGRTAKANLSLDAGVLAAMDAAAVRLHMSRSALVEMMAKRTLPELA